MRSKRILVTSIAARAVLLPLMVVPAAQASFPGSNGRIAVTRYTLTNTTERIVTMAKNGGDEKRLTKGTSAVQESWSPDGTKLAFARCPSNGNDCEIYTMDASGNHLRKITDNKAPDQSPAWSPDGKKLVIVRAHNSGLDLYVIRLSGGHARRLTKTPGDECDPAWSPDGTTIAYVSLCGGPSQIKVKPAAGGRSKNLTSSKRHFEFAPDWSPSGNRLVFVRTSKSLPAGEIYTMKADGSDVQRLTNNTRPESSPVYSPDGRKIAFVRSGKQEEDGARIFVMTKSGTHAFPVSPQKVTDSQPSWQAL
jgi:TolB protein